MRKRLSIAIVLSSSLLLAACSNGAGGSGGDGDGNGAGNGAGTDTGNVDTAAEEYPTETLDMTVAFGPGGGVDIMSRTIADLLTANDLYPHSITVNNREGGSGSNGYGYVFNQSGSGYDMAATSGSFISTPIQSDTTWDTLEFTPIALFGTDEVVIWVRDDSPWQTFEEFVEAAKTKPPAVGGAGATTIDFIAMSQVADQAGFEFNYVAHDGAPEAVNSLLSGSLDAVSHSASSVYGLYESGDVRPLAIGGLTRLPQMPDVPTLDELGYTTTVSQPRGIVMPPGVSDEVVAFWEDAFRKMAELPEWQDYLESNFITERLLFGEDFAEYLEETVAAYTAALTK